MVNVDQGNDGISIQTRWLARQLLQSVSVFVWSNVLKETSNNFHETNLTIDRFDVFKSMWHQAKVKSNNE
jgi:hypothetical protein